MSDRPLIIVSLEGLATAALGCYGSSWNQTPAIDAIASRGLVWDRCIASSDDPSAVLRGMMEPVSGGLAGSPSGDWAESWRHLGPVELLTDTPMDGIASTCFDRVSTLEFDTPKSSDLPATEVDQTRLGQLFAAAIERDGEDETWSVLWLHSSFLTRCWDAPRELVSCEEYEDSPESPSEVVELLEVETAVDPIALEVPPPIFDNVTPPQVQIDSDSHPDLVNSWMRTYGCQVRLLDLLIDVLLTSLTVEDPYVVIVGTSGFRLGQGGCIGHRPHRLRSPDIHLPMIVGPNLPLRVPQVTGSTELSTVLTTLGAGEPICEASRWIEVGSDASVETRSQQSQLAVTTASWFFVRDDDSSEHLYLKPDDLNDFNDVARIRDDVIEQLSEPKE